VLVDTGLRTSMHHLLCGFLIGSVVGRISKCVVDVVLALLCTSIDTILEAVHFILNNVLHVLNGHAKTIRTCLNLIAGSILVRIAIRNLQMGVSLQRAYFLPVNLCESKVCLLSYSPIHRGKM
jgi:hypothetical protein